MIWPLVEQNFNVKERRLRTRVDFDAERPSVYLYAAATLTAGQALALGLLPDHTVSGRVLQVPRRGREPGDKQAERGGLTYGKAASHR